MKVNIKYSCGHEGILEVFGKAEERERKIKYFEEFGLCPSCYKAEKSSEEKEVAEKHKLPGLKGSEKQISWASNILKGLIEKFEEEKQAIRKGAGDDFADFRIACFSSSWWIDRREWGVFKKDLLGKAVTAFKS